MQGQDRVGANLPQISSIVRFDRTSWNRAQHLLRRGLRRQFAWPYGTLPYATSWSPPSIPGAW